MGVAIRLAITQDMNRCLALISMLIGEKQKAGWEAAYRDLLEGKRGIILVAENKGEILGVLTASYNLSIRYGGEYCQIEELIVDSRGRGNNVGGLLVMEAINIAKAHGCAEIGVYLIESTESNRPFYEKFGFEYIGSELRQQLV